MEKKHLELMKKWVLQEKVQKTKKVKMAGKEIKLMIKDDLGSKVIWMKT
jgi:hypothetical protein